MTKTSLLLRNPVRVRKQTVAKITRDCLSLDRLKNLIGSFLMRGDIERHSVATLTNHRYRLGRLVWLAERQGWASIGYRELQQFFLYLNHGHEPVFCLDGKSNQSIGRWDNPRETEPLKLGSVKSLHLSLRAFFRWCVKDGELDICPIDRIASPIDRPDHIEPFNETQVNALLCAAKRTTHPLRDESIVLLLLDCGLRVSELTALCWSDIDFEAGQLIVREGKGGKSRPVPFGRNTKRVLWNYYQQERRGCDNREPVFVSDRGPDAGANALTRRGVALLVIRIGKRARISGTRCSPHTFRHTFACMMLRHGANIFALKSALGHTSMTMVNRYLSISQADLTAAHRLSSPADRLKEKGRE